VHIALLHALELMQLGVGGHIEDAGMGVMNGDRHLLHGDRLVQRMQGDVHRGAQSIV